MGDMNFSLTTFNKTGKLMQIEYALARVAQGKMSLGIKATNGVVIASDKKVSSVLVDDEEYQKIQSITPSTGISSEIKSTSFFTIHEWSANNGEPLIHFAGFVYSGMGPDFRVLVRNARKNAQKYFLTYREVQPVSEVVRESALLMQEYTIWWGQAVRCFMSCCWIR